MDDIPAEVTSWLREVFASCNERISMKMTLGPNFPEETFDLTWIEHLSHYATPVTLATNWRAKIDTHYLGGLRHYYGWEVADVGVLLFVRRNGRVVRSKVALLQSKRLYPTNNRVSEEGKTDYRVGFARLADPEDLATSLGVEAEFEFTSESKYGALIAKSDQIEAITQFEELNKLRVYYQFYNPWRVPFIQRVPISSYATPSGELDLGVRIMPAADVHRMLSGQPVGFRPRLSDLSHAHAGGPMYGWALERFIVDEFLACREGSVFESIGEERIQSLFYRRTGPISAAIAITIEEIAQAV